MPGGFRNPEPFPAFQGRSFSRGSCSRSRWRTTRRQFRNQRRAKLCGAATAVLEEKQGQVPQAGEIGAIDYRAALAFAFHQTGTRKCGEMCGHGVLRHIEQPGQLTGRHAVRLMTDQKTERLQPGCLGQRGECGDRGRIFHISRLMDILALSMPLPAVFHRRYRFLKAAARLNYHTVSVKRVRSSSDTTVNVPPCALAISQAMNRPSPNP